MPAPRVDSVDWAGDIYDPYVSRARKIRYGFKEQSVEEYISGYNIYKPVDKKSDPHYCQVVSRYLEKTR